MNRKISPLQRLRDGPPREKREHPGVPPRNPDPHPRGAAAGAPRGAVVRSASRRAALSLIH